jgi:hypothetical protein
MPNQPTTSYFIQSRPSRGSAPPESTPAGSPSPRRWSGSLPGARCNRVGSTG